MKARGLGVVPTCANRWAERKQLCRQVVKPHVETGSGSQLLLPAEESPGVKVSLHCILSRNDKVEFSWPPVHSVIIV